MAYTHDTTPTRHSTSVRSELEEHDWRVIQRIIDAVPQGETGIGALDDAYVQVMDETGAQDRHDLASIYHALLKIHEIKAPSLQARFQKFKAGISFDRSHVTGIGPSISSREPGTGLLVNPTSTVGEVEDLLSETETECSDGAPTVRDHWSQPTSASQDLKSRVPFLADADSDMAEEEEEGRNGNTRDRRSSASAHPRYSTHTKDLKIAAGVPVDDVDIGVVHDKLHPAFAPPATSTTRSTQEHAPPFDEPSFATGLLEMSTPIRLTTNRDAVDRPSTRDPSIPVTYAGHVYASSTVGTGSGRVADTRARVAEWDDTAVLELYDESFNNTISSIPSPAPRIATFPMRTTEQAEAAYPRGRGSSVESIDDADGMTLSLHQDVAMDELEREAEQMERAFVISAPAGRGKQELRLMRKKAESFWEFGLTLRTFRHWLQSFEYERVDQIQLIREIDHLKIARTFSRWRDLKARHDRSLRHASAIFEESSQRAFFSRWYEALRLKRQEQKADAIVQRRRMELVCTAWQNWRVKRLGRRTDRWKESMREKEVVVLEARQNRLISTAFKNWRFATAQHRAVSFNAAFLVATAFHQWAHLTQQVTRLGRVEERYQATRDRNDLKGAFVTWKRNLGLQRASHVIQDIVADNLEVGAWQLWRVRLAERQRSTAINDERTLREAISRWKTRMSKLKSLAKRAHGIMVDRDANVQRLAFNAWLASHNSKVVVEIRQERQVRSALNVWKERMDHIVEEHRKALAFDDKHIVNAARAALVKWRNRNVQSQLLLHQTTLFAERILQERMLRMWKDKMTRNKTLWIRAAGTRKFFMIKASWDKWHAKHQQKQQELFLVERKRDECRTIFASWLAAMQRARSLRQRSEDFALNYKQKRERDVFAHWMTRLIDVKDRAHEVATNTDKVLVRDAFEAWTRATIKQGEALSLMHSFRYVRQQERLHKIFHHWHFAYKEHKARRLILENKVERDRLTILASGFAQWRYRIRQRELGPLADDLRQKFDDGLAYAALSAWKGASKRLPAIEFHSRALKKRAWAKWSAALPEARRLRSAARTGDERLMGDMLFRWKLAYRARIARRVAARSRGGAGLLRMRPSGEIGLPSPVSRTPSPVTNARAASRRRALFRLDDGEA